MSQKELSKAAAADRLGVSTKQVERYVHEGMPCTGTGAERRFPWPEIRRWRDDLLRSQGRAEAERAPALPEYEEARTRKTIAEARLAEMEAAREEGRLVYVEQVDEVVEEIGQRVRAVLVNMPSTYVTELERLGVSPADGERVLWKIAEDLTRALRGVADDLDDDDGPDDGGAGEPLDTPPAPPRSRQARRKLDRGKLARYQARNGNGA